MTLPQTLIEMLTSVCSADRAVTYLEGEADERRVPFAELHRRALGILHHLQRLGAKPGDKLILFLSQNEPFIDAFWAAILGGIVPVPVAIGISDEHRHKLLRIARLLGQPYIYSDRKTLARIGNFATQSHESATWEALRARAFLVDELSDVSTPGTAYTAQPQDTAFIQFSSGSTSDPKGVVLTHANVVANWRSAQAAAKFHTDDVTLSWMPLTHDMGLLGMHIYMLASACHVCLMPTDLFVRRPLLWLQFAARKRATILSSPNFGYRHYLKVLGERDVTALDLSAVRLIFNGAEPISLALCDEFMTRLGTTGLRRTAMFPVYGLAEAVLAVSFPPLGAGYHAQSLDRHQLTVGAAVHRLTPNASDALTLVAVGRALPDTALRIAGDDDRLLPADHVGHIQIRGRNVTAGYFQNPQANATLHTTDGWLRTGDLGALIDGELYVTGRAKEIIFVNGQNYYPHDLEALLIERAGLELGKVVVSGVRRNDSATDELVAFVLHRGSLAEFAPLAQRAARQLSEQAGLELTAVVPVKRIPKTTSGKVQRHLLEAEYLDGQHDAELSQLASLRSAPMVQMAPGSSDIEARIKIICEATLGGRAVGVDDDFFELGASSLKLLEIHEQLEQNWPNKLDLTELFDHPTIAKLALHLQRKLAAAG